MGRADSIGLFDGGNYTNARSKNEYISAANLCYANGDIPGFNYYRSIIENDLGRATNTVPYKRFRKACREVDANTRCVAGGEIRSSRVTEYPIVRDFRDQNGDGRQQSWETNTWGTNTLNDSHYRYRRAWKEREIEASQKTEMRAFVDLVFSRIPMGLIRAGFSGTRIDYGETKNVYFTLSSWTNENSTDWLRSANGSRQKLLGLSPVDQQSVYANYSFSTFAAMPNLPPYIRWLFPLIVSQMDAGARYTHTGVNVRLLNDYQYDVDSRQLVSRTNDSQFSSHRIDIPLSAETRALEINTLIAPSGIPWQMLTLLKISGGATYSHLSRNMPDALFPIDENWRPAEYYRDVPIRRRIVNSQTNGYRFYDRNTDGIMDEADGDHYTYDDTYLNTQRTDHERFMNSRNDAGDREATAWWVSTWLSAPSFVEWMNLVGLVKKEYETGMAQRVNFKVTYRQSTDGIGDDNGLFPMQRSAFPTYVTYVAGDLNRNAVEDNGEDWDSEPGDLNHNGICETNEQWTQAYFDDFNENGVKDANEDYRYTPVRAAGPVEVIKLPAQKSTSWAVSVSCLPRVNDLINNTKLTTFDYFGATVWPKWVLFCVSLASGAFGIAYPYIKDSRMEPLDNFLAGSLDVLGIPAGFTLLRNTVGYIDTGDRMVQIPITLDWEKKRATDPLNSGRETVSENFRVSLGLRFENILDVTGSYNRSNGVYYKSEGYNISASLRFSTHGMFSQK